MLGEEKRDNEAEAGEERKEYQGPGKDLQTKVDCGMLRGRRFHVRREDRDTDQKTQRAGNEAQKRQFPGASFFAFRTGAENDSHQCQATKE